MSDKEPENKSVLTTVSLTLAVGSIAFFVVGLLTGSLERHRPDDGARDTWAFILCLVVGQTLAFGAWATGFAAILQRSSYPAWKAVVLMLLILVFLLMLFYSAWRGTAAFH